MCQGCAHSLQTLWGVATVWWQVILGSGWSENFNLQHSTELNLHATVPLSYSERSQALSEQRANFFRSSSVFTMEQSIEIVSFKFIKVLFQDPSMKPEGRLSVRDSQSCVLYRGLQLELEVESLIDGEIMTISPPIIPTWAWDCSERGKWYTRTNRIMGFLFPVQLCVSVARARYVKSNESRGIALYPGQCAIQEASECCEHTVLSLATTKATHVEALPRAGNEPEVAKFAVNQVRVEKLGSLHTTLDERNDRRQKYSMDSCISKRREIQRSVEQKDIRQRAI
jgi:hypothetical protein